ncbi:Nuclear factor related to kappa-B-binding protein [Sesbania bispinosa]|nr:Nuclear factor related to kappa-B-binding protein [Sesbania bispinosa]
MAIGKNSFKVLRVDSEFSPQSKETVFSDEDEVQWRNSSVDSDSDDGFDDADSGQGLEDILSVNVWNECLSEEDQFELAKYLPDMDQETFVLTLKELFTGCNLHFGSPMKRKRKDRKVVQKMGPYPSHVVNTGLEFHPRGRSGVLVPEKYGKQNPKGILKLDGSKTLSVKDLAGSILRMRDQLRNDENDEVLTCGQSIRRDCYLVDRSDILRVGKRPDLLKGDEIDGNLIDLSLSSKADLHGYTRNPNQSSDMKMFTAKPSSMRDSYDFSRKTKYPENAQQFISGDRMKSRSRGSHFPNKGNLVGSSDLNELFRNTKTLRSKKWKTGRESPDLSYMAYRVLLKSEETESNSSEQLSGDEDDNPLLQSKFSYSMGTADGSHMISLKSHLDPKKSKPNRKDMKEHGIKQSKKKGNFVEKGHMLQVENYLSKSKQKGKVCNGGPLHNSADKSMEESYPSGSDKLNDGDDDWNEVYMMGQNLQEPVEGLYMPSLNSYNTMQKKKGRIGLDHSILRSKYLHDYVGDEEDDSLEKPLLVDGKEVEQSRFGRNRKKAHNGDQNKRSGTSLLGCNSAVKKRKVKDDVTDLDGRDEGVHLLSNFLPHTDYSVSLKRKSKKKTEGETVGSEIKNCEPLVTDFGAADMELETKPQKRPFTLITPTVHTGFSFSIIHLLSAVRMAMVNQVGEDSSEVGKPREDHNKAQEGSISCVLSNVKAASNCEHADQPNMPSLTAQEIVNRVRSNPGDPCILETQEPLQDLVRGVLKIFSSKPAPLGAKGWKVLTFYEKSTRSWSWIGPVCSDNDTIEEVTSPEAWGLPHKMLVKLVDSFANWLKSGQETLQQLGSLPAPPLALMQVNLDEKERFRDLRAQKSLNTISPSPVEVRDYFRKEEILRYSIPDRAFSYTAADGKKSIVAPLRRCGGKPTSKARDHFMLKRDRPPHVTILCLVRDAAARLPGSIGTRADVCTLIRDSQYIVEDVSDAQINQVVSGALDRLHYELDPCVQYDGERKLWVYLHKEREEEDFEDDGTSSTKKWKRQKKDMADQSDQGTVAVAYHGTGEQNGYDLSSDLNVDPL